MRAAVTKEAATKETKAFTKIPDLLRESQSPLLFRIAPVEELNPSILAGTELEITLKARFILTI